MVAAEASIVAAEQAMLIERRGQRRRLRWVAGAAASYAIDALFLLLFALAGAAPLWLAAAFAAGIAVLNGVVYGVIATRRNLTLSDPGLILPQAVPGLFLQVAVVFVAPQLAFPWLANLMTVLAFSTAWVALRASLALWGLCMALCAALFYGRAGALGIASVGTFQVTLSWLFFSIILGRLVVLGAQSAWMRNRLHESRAKLAASMEQIRELASHDELTKTLNRRALIARLEQERGGAARGGAPFCVALLDLDHFKSINDRHGHGAGDQVLQRFARTVHATMRETDIFGRYGGEEFLMILTDTTLDGARRALQRIGGAIAATDYRDIAQGLSLTVSVGIAEWKRDEETPGFLARTDAALYRAKAGGRNRIEAA